MTADPMCRYSDEEIDRMLSAPGPSSRESLAAVDVHTHYLPPRYRRLLVEAGLRTDSAQPEQPEWSAQRHLEHMDRLGIDVSVVSVSTPGVQVTPDPRDGVRIARMVNEEGAELVAEHPRRFGFYAALPAPDVDASLEEIAYAVDTLGAWGVSLLTNVHGVYLGDPRLDPIFEELSRRELPVLIHPARPAVMIPGVMEGGSTSMYEYFFDTSRTVVNLFFSGTLMRHPGVKLVIPHAGAALPALAQRIERNVWLSRRVSDGELPSFIDTLRGCFFDLAGSVLPHQLASLLELADEGRIVYGSDFPFTGAAMGSELGAELRVTDRLSDEQKRRALRDNAFALFPQLDGIAGAGS